MKHAVFTCCNDCRQSQIPALAASGEYSREELVAGMSDLGRSRTFMISLLMPQRSRGCYLTTRSTEPAGTGLLSRDRRLRRVREFSWSPPAAYVVCRSCHVYRLHQRFAHPKSWTAFLAHVRRGGYAREMNEPAVKRDVAKYREALNKKSTLPVLRDNPPLPRHSEPGVVCAPARLIL